MTPPKNLVRQGKYECAPATLATLTGHTLFIVKRVMSDFGWRNDDYGATNKMLIDSAEALGCGLIPVRKRFLKSFVEDFPPAILTLPSLNYPGSFHAVTWLDGEIVDPNFGDPTRKFWYPFFEPKDLDVRNALIFSPEPIRSSDLEWLTSIQKRDWHPDYVRDRINQVLGR